MTERKDFDLQGGSAAQGSARNTQKADKTAVGENLLKFPIFSFIRVYGMHKG
jgi:hypothetical protein